MKTKILICTHKEVELPHNEVFFPVQTGSALTTLHWGIQRDDEGINISTKNKNYSELTAHYWFWKNYTDYEYVGLCHYRRYFQISYSQSHIEKLLRKSDIILPTPIYLPYSNGTNLTIILTREDLYILLLCLKKTHPEYLPEAENYLFNTNRNISFNMFITRKEIFQAYSAWLFPILEETEKYVKLSGYTRLKRIYGYFSEVLLPIWVKHNGLKTSHFPIINYPNQKMSLMQLIKNPLINFRNNLCFHILHGFKHRNFKPLDSVITGMKTDGIPLY